MSYERSYLEVAVMRARALARTQPVTGEFDASSDVDRDA